jgi:hypothetical protein
VTREQLEHLIRAAGEIADDDLVVIGSQAILATHPDAPPSLLVSMEADVYPRRDPAAARAVDAAIGDGSPFHETYGYYAHGVGPETAKAPAGWEDRLIRIDAEPLTRTQRRRSGWCLEAHDLMLAKLARGEERDWEFVETSIREALVDVGVLRERSRSMPVAYRTLVVERLEGVIARAATGPQGGNKV